VRIVMIVNAFASSVTARNRVLIQQALRQAGTVTVVETNRRGHATRFAQDAALRGVDVVVALGGDGTLNEAANGLAGTDTALAVLPGGSTNVFARSLGLPNDPVPAARLVVASLLKDTTKLVGLGQVNGRYFCFHTGIGFDAAVVRRVEHQASLKRWVGHPLFIWAVWTTWMGGYDRRHPHFAVGYPDGTTIDNGYFTVVLNTNPYTFLGNRPLDLSSAATLDRGLVAVTFRSLSAGAFLTNLGRALRGKGIATSKTADVRTDLDALVVESDRPFPHQVDGDELGDTHRLAFRHAPDILRLVTPPPPIP
jgi:diacylglycerol kinase family enzyme